MDQLPPPEVALQRLAMLWVNTGTLCNIACVDCFMASTPLNDALAYFPRAGLAEILATAPAGVDDIGFTGGEPFMNPDLLAMLTMVLQTGRRVLVLTNGMRPMQRLQAPLAALIAAWPGQVQLRVSLDHYTAAGHEALRGPDSFAPALAGLCWLASLGADVSVAARKAGCAPEAAVRQGFAALFAAHGLMIDADDPTRLVLFPELDAAASLPPPSAAALCGLNPMCATARMVVWRRGASTPEFTPCTLLPELSLGIRLADSLAPVALDHPHCSQFCIAGRASCAGR